MSVTLSGIIMLVRLVQPSKVQSPMSVTLSGIVMLVRFMQFLKAPQIFVTLSGTIYDLSVFPFGYIKRVS